MRKTGNSAVLSVKPADVLSVKPVTDIKAQPGAGKEEKHEIHHNINKTSVYRGSEKIPRNQKPKILFPQPTKYMRYQTT